MSRGLQVTWTRSVSANLERSTVCVWPAGLVTREPLALRSETSTPLKVWPFGEAGQAGLAENGLTLAIQTTALMYWPPEPVGSGPLGGWGSIGEFGLGEDGKFV